jgi:hypothetical protein
MASASRKIGIANAHPRNAPAADVRKYPYAQEVRGLSVLAITERVFDDSSCSAGRMRRRAPAATAARACLLPCLLAAAPG